MDIFDLDDDFESAEPKSSEDTILSALNPEQKEAVLQTEGPLLVLAGAGTGKTKVLTTRIAFLIKQGLCRPYECMAVTFTNKAAKEMNERLYDMIGDDSQNVWLGTFHRIGLKLLRRHADRLGFDKNFNILNDSDQERLLKQIVKDFHKDPKEYSPKVLADLIDSFKNKGYLPDTLPESLLINAPFPDVRLIYHTYQERLKILNAMDFSDLLLLSFELLRHSPDLAMKYQRQFKYILVDEYQDTNVIQYLWLRLLAQGYNNICCVGDDDQSIYSWRGAEVQNILRFPKEYKNAKIIRLESNYRSTENILGAASSLIAHNKTRMGKTLHVAPDKSVVGEKVRVQGFWDAKEEALSVAREIDLSHHYAETAVLVRANAQTREFEEAFSKNGVPYKVVGGYRFYEREEIRDILAYLRLIAEPRDDMAFIRIINKPKRGIGAASIEKLQEFANENHQSLCASASVYPSQSGAFSKMKQFCDYLSVWQKNFQTMPLETAAKIVMIQSGYLDMWKSEKTLESEGKIENLYEFLNVLADCKGSLTEFLEQVSLMTDTDDENVSEEQVSIMTLHGAKGLEFDTVYLPAWEDGMFPTHQAMDEGNVEEERRLAYVGLTRARKEARVSFAVNRQIYGQWQSSVASRFISEMDSKYLNIQIEAGLPNPFKKEMSFQDKRLPEKSFFYDNFRGNSNRFDRRTSDDTPAFSKPVMRQTSSDPSKITKGMQVVHETFGSGVVLEADGDRLKIFFNKGGMKKIMASFVKKA